MSQKKILVVDDEDEIREIISFMLESQLDVKCIMAASGNDAIKMIDQHSDLSCVVCDYSMSNGNGEVVFTHLKATRPQVPFILCSSFAPNRFEIFKTNPPEGYIVKPDLFPNLQDLVQKILFKDQAQETPVRNSVAPEYCRIPTTLVLRLGLIQYDLYVKTGHDKYIKIFNSGEVFDADDLDRIQTKNLEYLHIKQVDATHSMNLLLNKLKQLISPEKDGLTKNLSALQRTRVSASTLELISHFSDTFGFTEVTKQLTEASVNLVLNSIRENAKISDLFESYLHDEKSYRAAHSISLSYYACGIASLLGWASDTTFHTLTLASFFHDLGLKSDELARIRSEKALNGAVPPFSEAEKTEFRIHPKASVKLLEALGGAPAYTDTIILQHHDEPGEKSIQPLSAVLIVAHDLLDFIGEKTKSEVSYLDFLALNKDRYSKEPFKRIYKEMTRALA